MNRGIDDFCNAILELGETDRDSLVHWCAFITGFVPKETDVEVTEDTPIGDMYERVTMDDLRRHLNYLADTIGQDEHFLVAGTLTWLIDFYDGASTCDSTSDSIDMFLGMIGSLEKELQLPREQRRFGGTDEQLREFIEKNKKLASTAPEQRELAEGMLKWATSLRDGHFTIEYWKALNLERMRRRES